MTFKLYDSVAEDMWGYILTLVRDTYSGIYVSGDGIF